MCVGTCKKTNLKKKKKRFKSRGFFARFFFFSTMMGWENELGPLGIGEEAPERKVTVEDAGKKLVVVKPEVNNGTVLLWAASTT